MTTFMAREIAECGAVVARCLTENEAAFAAAADDFRARDPAVVVTNARGSSDHCALYLKYLIEIMVGLPCASIGPSIASLYRAQLRLERAVAVSVSQSGRSPDIVAAQRAAREGGALTLALVNDESSPLAGEAARLIGLRAGEERSVAATKSMIAGMTAGAALAAGWARDDSVGAALRRLPDALIVTAPPPEPVLASVAESTSAFVLGRGSTFAAAAEAALKLKETCAIHAEAFSAAEVLHGPAEIVRPGFLVLAFPPRDEAAEGFGATLARFRALGARVVTIESGVADGADRLGAADAGHPLLAPIAMIHRFYALAEAVARRLGRDPDHPQNLRKVTETR
jgi:glucosamine--fructose-6-phosphate aminotransferase (isomerizing)